MIFEEAQADTEEGYLKVGDLVQLRYLDYKVPDYEQLCNYQNSNTLGLVVEVFHNSFKELGFVDEYYLISVLIDGTKYKSLARNWIKK